VPPQQGQAVVAGWTSGDTNRMPVAPKSILIGIPSFRRPDGLRNLLASLESQEGVDAEHIEVFVADNDPDRREAQQVYRELACEFRWPLTCKIVDEAGISAARNAILERARETGADLVAMLDDDEVTSPKWLSELLRAEQRFGADVVAGPVKPNFEHPASRSMRNSGLFAVPDHCEGFLSIIRGAGNILISSSALAAVGWPNFDPSFGLTGGEDHEFFLRVRELGFRFAWAPRAEAFEAIHACRLRRSWILRRAFSLGHTDTRIRRHRGDTMGLLVSLTKAAALLVSAPVGAVLLILPSRRLWILAKWSRSFGKLAALMGFQWHEYAPARITGAAT
jgi:GT2 family glycosyltransferase